MTILKTLLVSAALVSASFGLQAAKPNHEALSAKEAVIMQYSELAHKSYKKAYYKAKKLDKALKKLVKETSEQNINIAKQD